MVRLTDLEVGRPSWRERRLEEWLAALPHAEPTRALDQIARSVRALNGTVIEPDLRTALLVRYEKSVHDLAAALRRPGAPPEHLALLTLVNSEMAHGYEMALTPGGRTQNQVRAMLGAITHLSEVVRDAYRAYLPVPPGLWRRIHVLYGKADGDPDAGISAAYKEIILLGLADPYGLPTGALDAVTALVAQLNVLARLPAASGFRVEPLSDVPARLGGGALEAYYIDTRPLVAEVGRLRTALRDRGTLPSVWAGSVLPDLAERLLTGLSSAWLPEPQTRSARVQLSGERLVCQGFTALHAAAGENAKRLYVDLDAEWREGQQSVAVTQWRIGDAGCGGLWLNSSETNHEGRAPRPGSLVGVRDPNGKGGWQAAVVRWAKRARPRQYAMGLEILGTAYSGLAGRGREFPFAVILVGPTQEGPVTLLAPAGRVVAGRSLRIETAGREAVYLPLVRLDRVGGLDRFELAGGLAGQLIDSGAHKGVDTRVGRENTATF